MKLSDIPTPALAEELLSRPDGRAAVRTSPRLTRQEAGALGGKASSSRMSTEARIARAKAAARARWGK